VKRVVVGMVLLALATSAAAVPRERRAYLAEYRAWTRELFVHESFSTALILRGTLLEPGFRDAASAERQRLLGASDADAAAFRERMTSDGEAYHEVVFSADTAMPGRLRFGPGDDRWNVRLLADGVEEPLVTVYFVRTPTPLHQGLYPHKNIWSELFIARFHRSVERPDRVELTVGSGYGNGSLVWTGLRDGTPDD
jgi:hypothetical protein